MGGRVGLSETEGRLWHLCVALFAVSLWQEAAAGGTGRFAVQRQGRGWTLVTPDGNPIFITGLNHLTSFPCAYDDKACHDSDLWNNHYHQNWTELAADFVANLKAWGFNSAGYGQSEAGWSMYPHFAHILPTQASPDAWPGPFHFTDVFSATFNTTTDAATVKVTRKVQRTGPQNCVGYYFMDIPLWGLQDWREGLCLTCHWPGFFRSLNQTTPGKMAWVAFLQDHFGSNSAGLLSASSVYNVSPPAQSWGQLLSDRFLSVNLTSPAVIDCDTAFLGVVAERIYSVAAAAVRRHDPGALVFGDRFIQTDMPLPVLKAAAKYFDVVTVQPQPFSLPSSWAVNHSILAMANVSLVLNKPVMIADQATHYTDPRMPFPAQKPCAPTEQAAGELYDQYLTGLRATNGAIVGYAHCQYIDRRFNHENITKQGLLQYSGEPRAELCAAITRANHKVNP